MNLKTDFSEGDVFYAGTTASNDKLNGITNEINLKGKIHQIYTGTGFNSVVTATGTDEQDHELDLIPASNLNGDYIIIECNCNLICDDHTANSTQMISFKIQTKEDGGTYSDSLPYTTQLYVIHSGYSGPNITLNKTITHYHQLTNDEKANGVYIKLFSKSALSTTSLNKHVSFTNVQTVIKNP